MKQCSRCILPETYPGISFNEEGICNYCTQHKVLIPHEEKLNNYIRMAKKKKRIYDVLVPLSGGKDSTYVLYLAKKIYNLKVLAYTFDNGFLSDVASNNIKSVVGTLGVDHILIKPSWDKLKKLYRNVLLRTGELCTVCGIGISHNSFKISADWRIPLIFSGDSLMESNSYSPEQIYDINRFKVVMKEANDVSYREIKDFLIYPNMNPIRLYIYPKLGRWGKIVRPLHYIQTSQKDISNILKKECGWQEGNVKQKKHFDCWAEPFTNFLREKRFGYSRRACQFSNLIRTGEMTRKEALEKMSEENPEIEPEETSLILENLGLTREEFNQILGIPAGKYEQYAFNPKLVSMARKVVEY